MKQTPILFSTEMVQAILAGRKTQTRRVIKPQPQAAQFEKLLFDGRELTKNSFLNYCPYGQPGDVLWVRETFATGLHSGLFYFKANGEKASGTSKWKPSIHMPKAAARIWLEITNVRVERLQDITQDDAVSEGITQIKTERPATTFQKLWQSINGKPRTVETDQGTIKLPPVDWHANPWVWVVEFKRTNKPT